MVAPGLLVVLLWLGLVLVSVVAAVVHVVRSGRSGLLVAAGLVGGPLATAGLVVGVLGLLEGAWSSGSGAMLVAVAIGLAGLTVSVVCWRAMILHRRPGPGQCPTCRYPVDGLERCPECGLVRCPECGRAITRR